MKHLFNKLAAAVLVGLSVLISSFAGTSPLGFSVATGYQKSLRVSMNATQTTIPVTSLTLTDGTVLNSSTFPGRIFLMLDAGKPTRQEITMCTGIDEVNLNFDPCVRGLAFSGTSTASVPGNRRTHNAGAIVTMANVHYVYDELTDKDSDETVNGKKTFPDLITFGTIPVMPTTTPTSSNQVASKMYVDNVIAAGAPDGTETIKGIWEGATQAEMISGALTGGTGAGLVLQSRYVTSTRSGTGSYLVLTAPSGYVSSSLGGVAFSMATLNSSALVVQNPASASIFAATSSMPLTSSTSTKLDASWVNQATMFGDGSDGNVTIAIGTSTLTRDMYYNNLTIQTGGVIDPSGFRIFVKGTLTFEGTGKISDNGGAGGAGANGTTGGSGTIAGGTAGTVASTGGSLPDSKPGSAGGNGDKTGDSGTAGSMGTAGVTSTKTISVAGSTGGAGGTGGNDGDGGANGVAGFGAGVFGPTTTAYNKPNSIMGGYYLIDTNGGTLATINGSSGSGGGGGGGGGGNASGNNKGMGGGGGGSGATGGNIWVSAANIVTVNGNVYIEANGGAGGNGGNGGVPNNGNGGGAAGGGGGAGGSGGFVILYYGTKTGTGTVSVAGGAGGTKGSVGAPHGTGTAASAAADGTAGVTGTTYLIQL